MTFKLPDDEEDHPFKGLDVGSKKGQLLEMEIAIYEGDGDIETLGRTRKPRARVKPNLPVVKDEAAPDQGRKRAALENVTRRVIKAGSESNSEEDAERATNQPSSSAPIQSAVPEAPKPPEIPVEQPMPPTGGQGTHTESSVDPGNLDAYANQMGQAAEALAAVAEKLDDQVDDDDRQFPTLPIDAEDNMDPGTKAVRRATDLCKAIDKQRAGFYYFMRSRYPQAPKLAGEEGSWSRDAKSTRDRVCLHCEATHLDDLAEDSDARRKFEELETEFERHERLR